MIRAAILFGVLLAAFVQAEDWAIHVPGGSKFADDLAKGHSLENLGEVIPESNIFHIRVPKHSRSKRDTASLKIIHDSLESHDQVEWLEHQNTPLKRVKRGPLPPLEPNRFLSPRQSQGPLCFVNTIGKGEAGPKRCVFPFQFKDKTYLKCTSDHSSNGAPWCATEVRPDGEVIPGQWGDCDEESFQCFNIKPESGPSRPSPPRQSLPQTLAGPRLPPGASFLKGRLPRPFPFQLGQDQGGFGRPQGQGGPPRGFPPQGRPRLPLSNDPRFGGPGGKLPPFFQGGFPNGGGAGRLPFRGPPPPGAQGTVNFYENEIDQPSNLSALKTKLDDPAWPSMWFLNRGGESMDMNVEDAWEQGYSGKGVKVTILDDGIEVSHPDLKDNYDPKASIDFNDNDADPSPRYDPFNYNKHGTRCAGTVAASANNSQCGVGIAFNAKVGGIRILDGPIVDMLEAKALSYNRDYIDIYSASWGPDDNGETVDGPGKLAKKAIEEGIAKGRSGKGSIFVWASGNGGKHADSCNCDGYTTSIYTLSVSSASENGLIPWYSESCSSSLATTYSSGSKTERKVVTTDLRGGCTNKHTGTSASSPMAAAIVALTLEANPNLTWRDVQHVTVRSARPEGNLKGGNWRTNGVGRMYSHAFGFGLMDAGAMTRLAKDWTTVPEQFKCTTAPGALAEPLEILPDTEQRIVLNAQACQGIKFIEQIHLHIDLKSLARRGQLSVMLISPMGTESVLLAPRPKDRIRSGLDLFSKWPMMSVHFWGESVLDTDTSSSDWTLLIRNTGDRESTLNDFQISFYGTETDPQPENTQGSQSEDAATTASIPRIDIQDEATTAGGEGEQMEPEITTFRPQVQVPVEVGAPIGDSNVPEDVELIDMTNKPLKLQNQNQDIEDEEKYKEGEENEQEFEGDNDENEEGGEEDSLATPKSSARKARVQEIHPDSYIDFSSPAWQGAEIPTN
ncbi:hypothetical protein TCAL_01234 [Tigriopus californicus]|uniref:furin n=1 Tax=Tigriopus californicus TaxID=6832 RepID=A0A553NZF3_TIGCA|nr:furin-like [Tigriopus californicus]TRY70805.1 hypothetical protein TCAL_01234 [Tigriopus californicus]